MSHQPEEIRNRTDRLDSVGNTTKALTQRLRYRQRGAGAFHVVLPLTSTK